MTFLRWDTGGAICCQANWQTKAYDCHAIPSSNALWIIAGEALRRKLPKDAQEALDRCEKDGKTGSKEYQDAVNADYAWYLYTVDPVPQPLDRAVEWLKDPTVYLTMLVCRIRL
jgi:hypothetical protein